MALTQVQGAMVGPTGFANLSGITFPATAVPSADANTLDDYEEGSWEPTLTASSGSFSSVGYDADTGGKYIKIGQMVYLTGTLRWTTLSVGSASGTAFISGLPFFNANRTNGDNADSPGTARTAVWGGTSTRIPTTVSMLAGLTSLFMGVGRHDATNTSIQVNELGSTGMVTFTCIVYTS
jgi:hypothetical protein